MTAPSSPERAPVLLVPGAFGQDLLYWNVMQYLLERKGHHVYTLTFPTLTLRDLRVSAHLLAAKVQEVLESEETSQVTLVAHSMGGLIARHYLQALRGGPSVRRLVCLGTPHRGTYAGLVGYPLAGARQILPGSPFLQELNDPRNLDTQVPIVNIWARNDLVVVPNENARLSGPNVTDVRVTLGGHWSLLFAPRVLRWVAEAAAGEALTGATVTPPEAVPAPVAES